MNNNWRDKEPTQAQLSFLEGLGYTYKVPSTRGEASDIINTLKKRKIRMNGQLPANDFVIQTALVRVTFDEKEVSLAQEKLNMYLSDGFEFWRTYPVVAEGQQIGKIVWLGKTQPATSEERMQ